MSLRAFHIVFITASIALALVVGGWGTANYVRNGQAGPLYLGLTCFLGSGVLIVYFAWFLRKLKAV